MNSAPNPKVDGKLLLAVFILGIGLCLAKVIVHRTPMAKQIAPNQTITKQQQKETFFKQLDKDCQEEWSVVTFEKHINGRWISPLTWETVNSMDVEIQSTSGRLVYLKVDEGHRDFSRYWNLKLEKPLYYQRANPWSGISAKENDQDIPDFMHLRLSKQ